MSRRAHPESGAALVEASLVLSFITCIFLGITGLALALSQAMTVTYAAEAGALYGTLAGNNNDTTGMQTAAGNAALGLNGFSATATTWCACSPGGATVSCTSTCSGSNPTPFEYVQVNTRASVPMITNYPGLSSAASLKGSSIMRVH